jgi:hypothetical protein
MNDDPTGSNPEFGDDRSVNESLRSRFAGLRREDERRAPEFAALWRRRESSRRRSFRWLAAGACALIALGAMLWMRSSPRYPENNAVASIVEWQAPTDFLLETPGREVLRSVPEIGRWRGYLPAASPSPAGKKVLH